VLLVKDNDQKSPLKVEILLYSMLSTTCTFAFLLFFWRFAFNYYVAAKQLDLYVNVKSNDEDPEVLN
jgi:hypothetical protein